MSRINNKLGYFLLMVLGLVLILSIYRFFTIGTFKAESNYNTFFFPKVSNVEEQTIDIMQPLDLNGRSVHSITEARRQIINKIGVSPNYVPSAVVFGRIKDNLPWWSIKEMFFGGTDRPSIKGASQESRNIFNPLLLLAPEFWGLTNWVGSGFQWREDIVADPVVFANSSTIIPYPQLTAISMNSQTHTITVEYDVSGFIEAVKPYLSTPISADMIDFGVSGYNARDFNLRFTRLVLDKSQNIKGANYNNETIKIVDYLGAFKNMCFLDLECNHRTQRLLPLDGIKILELPASAVFYLSRNVEEGQAIETPDVTYIIKFY